MQNFNQKHFRSIKTKIAMLYFLLITVLIGTIGIIFYIAFTDSMISRVTEDQKSISSQIAANLNLLVNDLNYSFVYLSADRYITEILNKKQLDIVNSSYYYNELWTQFNNIICLPGEDINEGSKYYLFLNKELPLSHWLPQALTDKYELVDTNGVYISENVKNAEWYKQAVRANGRLCFCLKDKTGMKQLYVIKKIKNDNLILADSVGVAVVVLPPSTFSEQINDINCGKHTRILLTDENSNIIYSNGELNEGKLSNTDIMSTINKKFLDNDSIITTINGKQYITSAYHMQWGWKFVSAEPLSDFLIIKSTGKIIILVILLILLGGMLTVTAARRFSCPIIKLAGKMKTIDVEKPIDIIEPKMSNDEIGILYDSFYKLMENMRGLISDIRLSNTRQLDAEFEALQAQINPHFIYNALNSINWTIMMRNQNDIAQTVSELSDILKYSIVKSDSKVTLLNEIEHVKKFVDIEKLHYGNGIDIKFDVAENTLNCIMPKFILQPLVENSITHGIACKEQKNGHIIVSTKIQEEVLMIIIEDNGVGANTDELNQMLQKEKW